MNYDDNAKRIGRRVQASTRQAIPRPHMTETLSPGSARSETESTEGSIGCMSQRADRIEAIETRKYAEPPIRPTVTAPTPASALL